MSDALRELDILRQNLVKTISPDLMYSKIRQEKLSVHLSEEILDLVNPDCGAILVSETVKLRQKVTDELGYVIPKIIFKDDDDLNSFEFNVKVRGLEILRASVYPGYRMFFEDELNLTRKKKDAIYAVDAISGRQLIWLQEDKIKDFWEKGMTPSDAICRLIEYVVVTNIEDLFDYADVNKYMEIVGDKNMFLIENIIPDFVSVAELRYILVNLLREKISIKDIVFIFEKINDFSDEETKEDLLDKLRLSLGKFITAQIADDDGIVQAFGLSDKTYASLFSKINTQDMIVKIEGKKIEKIAKSLLKSAKTFDMNVDDLKLIVPVEVRHMAFMILSQFIPNITVVAREELSNDCKIDLLEEI
ncbi:FHIPEP family type III secretion protein [bacterium]|nr:FHIPEP family type III secretion protein [bacterium]